MDRLLYYSICILFENIPKVHAKKRIIFLFTATSFLLYLYCVREMNIQINGMIWIKSIVKQPPLSLFPSSFLGIDCYFVDGELLSFFYLLLYSLYCLRITCWRGISFGHYYYTLVLVLILIQMTPERRLSNSMNVVLIWVSFCPEIEKQHILYPYYISTIQVLFMSLLIII